MIRKSLVMLALAALLCLLPAVAFADISPFWEFSSPATAFTNNTWAFGEVFTANQNINVGFLGYYNPQPGGLGTSSHEVALYDASGTMLADTFITANSLY